MKQGVAHHHSHLFMVRLWAEELDEHEMEWRGQIQHVKSRETRYFRDWSTVVTFILAMLPTLDGEEGG